MVANTGKLLPLLLGEVRLTGHFRTLTSPRELGNQCAQANKAVNIRNAAIQADPRTVGNGSAGMFSRLCFVAICFSVAASVTASNGSVSPDESVAAALKLKTEYSKEVRPPPQNGTANLIGVFLNMDSLVKVDSAAQEITGQFWLEMHWTDSRLAWLGRFNSTSLDAVDSIALPADLLWQPDVSFYNTMKIQRVSGEAAVLAISSAGVVLSESQLLVTSKCPMQLLAFPYDTQTCRMSISSITRTVKAIRLRVKPFYPNESITVNFARSNEFCVTSVRMEINEDVGGSVYDRIDLLITFSRRSTFYVVNLILPSVLLLAISSLTFRLPPQCDERVSFSITIVLSMCVFLQLTGDYTPTQSESVPLLTGYYTMAVVMTMANVLGNVFVVRCHFNHLTDTRINNRVIRALFLNRFATGRCHGSTSVDSGRGQRANKVGSSPEPMTSTEASSDPAEPHKATAHASADTSRPRSAWQERDTGLHDDNEWKIVETTADNCFFAFFAAATAAIALALAVIEAATSNGSNNRCLGKAEG